MRAFTRISALMAMMGLGSQKSNSKSASSKGRNYFAGGFPKNPRKIIPKGCKETKYEGHRIVYLNKENLDRKIRNIQAN
jgi:hypothetical protein